MGAAGHRDADLVVETIDEALAAPIGGAVRSRGDPVTSDDADYWSALLSCTSQRLSPSVVCGRPSGTPTFS